MRAFDPEAEAFAELTRRPFLVLDLETTYDTLASEQRVVSFAYTLINSGSYEKSNSYYNLVNPGMPISKDSTRVHGLTDADVAKAKDFAFHSNRLMTVMQTNGAIFVAQNARFDTQVLQYEFSLLGLSIPDLPVLDTMYLPSTLKYPLPGLTNKPGLAALASALGIPLTNHHNALADVEATSEILLKLLRYAASTGMTTEIDELLGKHRAGTTTSLISRTKTSKAKGEPEYQIDTTHLALHQLPLGNQPTQQEIHAWVMRASECATLLCPLLADECEAEIGNNSKLYKELSKEITQVSKPGEMGTLLGGFMRLIDPLCYPSPEIWFWRNFGTQIAGAPRCTALTSCPDCRRNEPCPIDVVHEYLGRSLMFDKNGIASEQRINNLIMKKGKGYIYKWSIYAPKIAAYVNYLCVVDAQRRNRKATADSYIAVGIGLGFDKTEPQLALLIAQNFVEGNRLPQALQSLIEVVDDANTNPIQVAVRSGIAKIEAEILRRKLPVKVRNPKFIKASRPETRVRNNPYRLK
jgi:DNA polymerase III epsilon subunit-like protein